MVIAYKNLNNKSSSCLTDFMTKILYKYLKDH